MLCPAPVRLRPVLDGAQVRVHQGATWTTDAPFRETAEAIEGRPFSQALRSSPACHSLALLQSMAPNADFMARIGRRATPKLEEAAA